MPAARQRSRSPFMAWAVKATMGTWPPVAFSRSRMAAVAAKPSISGICMSMRIEVHGLPLEGGKRLPAVAGHHDGVPALLQRLDRQFLVHLVVFRQQDAEGSLPLRGRRPRRCGATPARSRGTAPRAVRMASNSSDCVIGLRR